MIRAEQADVLAQLEGIGVRVTDDPAAAETNRPCVLVGPPSLDYTERTVTHRLVALTSHPAGTLAALDQLDQLVAAVAELLPLESAEPTSYALTAATDPTPAYVMRVTGDL